MLKAVDVTKLYKKGGLAPGKKQCLRAVDGVSLEVDRGECVGLLGESGCGKSTLSRLLVGLDRPTSGAVFLEGTNIGRCRGVVRKDLRRKLQLVFQDPYCSLDPRMTVFQIIDEALSNHFKLSLKEREERIGRLLDQTGLPPSIKFAFPHELSGGQRQRVALARAISLAPEYLILDEPLASLDVSIQAQVLNLLVDLRELYNSAYVFISHDLKAVRYLCDRAAVMYNGKIVEMLPVSRLFHPQHPYTAMLVSTSSRYGEKVCFDRYFAKEDNREQKGGGCGFAGYCREADGNCYDQEPVLQGKGHHRVACLKRSL